MPGHRVKAVPQARRAAPVVAEQRVVVVRVGALARAPAPVARAARAAKQARKASPVEPWRRSAHAVRPQTFSGGGYVLGGDLVTFQAACRIGCESIGSVRLRGKCAIRFGSSLRAIPVHRKARDELTPTSTYTLVPSRTQKRKALPFLRPRVAPLCYERGVRVDGCAETYDHSPSAARPAKRPDHGR
jgi:hypothetical protein